jgi:GH15 family glucan-1,4-alpha-glucosidase
MCVAGLRAMAGHASAGEAAKWSLLADAILADASRDCTHPTGRWQRAPGDPRVDAALLLPAIRGAIPAQDPRSQATLAAVATDVGREGFTYRFRHDERPLGDAEGAFLLCGFWMALATHQVGRDVDAMAHFERNRSACGPPALFTEEFDVVERQLRGNIPQAFVHALLLESAVRLKDLEVAW